MSRFSPGEYWMYLSKPPTPVSLAHIGFDELLAHQPLKTQSSQIGRVWNAMALPPVDEIMSAYKPASRGEVRLSASQLAEHLGIDFRRGVWDFL